MAGCAKTDERMLERGLPGEGGTARPKEPMAPPRGLRSKALPGVDTIGGIGTAMEVTAAAPACGATSSPESLKKMEGAVLSSLLAPLVTAVAAGTSSRASVCTLLKIMRERATNCRSSFPSNRIFAAAVALALGDRIPPSIAAGSLRVVAVAAVAAAAAAAELAASLPMDASSCT